MKISEFKCLKGRECERPVLFHEKMDYAQAIYNANIPYRPGVYLVYSTTGQNYEDKELLYYGKAGVTKNGNKPSLNFHQLPIRLLAATKRPKEYMLSDKNDVSRANLWPWYIERGCFEGIRIYWFITEWPTENPNVLESQIKRELPHTWKKKI
jgi:hypothetical protein